MFYHFGNNKVRKLAGEYTFHFIVSSVSFLFATFFSSHKVYNIQSIYQLYIYWRHHLLVLMKLFNRWSSKSFFASLRRSLCLFFQLLFTRIDLFSSKMNWISFFICIFLTFSQVRRTTYTFWNKNSRILKEPKNVLLNRFRWHDTCFKDIIALL